MVDREKIFFSLDWIIESTSLATPGLRADVFRNELLYAVYMATSLMHLTLHENSGT